jgi:hypothetical protein
MIDPAAFRPQPGPRCRGECKRTAADPVADSPAESIEIRPGRRILMCKCCRQALRYETTVGGFEMIPGARAVNPRIYSCMDCGYDVKLMAAIEAS